MAVKGKHNYVAISYVWQQWPEFNKLEAKIKEHIDISINCWRYTGKCCLCNNGITHVWLDKMSNITVDGSTNIEGIKKMDLVYKRATLTIALIPEMEDSLVDSEKLEILAEQVIAEIESDEGYFIERIRDYHSLERQYKYRKTMAVLNPTYVLSDSEWFGRAWTFQEQCNSRKIIVMIRKKLYDISEIVKDFLTISVMITHRSQYIKAQINKMLYLKSELSVTEMIKNLKYYINYEWSAIYDQIVNYENQYSFRDRILKLCQTSRMPIVDLMLMVDDRCMGEENLGYEPIIALARNTTCEYIEDKPYNISILLSDEARSKESNKCWLPKKLKTCNRYVNYNSKFTINCEGKCVIQSGESIRIMCEDMTSRIHDEYLMYDAGYDTKRGFCKIYMLLKIISEDKDKYETHFIRILSMSDIAVLKTTREMKIYKKKKRTLNKTLLIGSNIAEFKDEDNYNAGEDKRQNTNILVKYMIED